MFSDIKKFKRFLKELGLYRVYVHERNKYIDRENFRYISNGYAQRYDKKTDFWKPVEKYHDDVGRIIDASLTWANTNNRELWSKLNSITAYKSIDECLCEVDGIKKTLKNGGYYKSSR